VCGLKGKVSKPIEQNTIVNNHWPMVKMSERSQTILIFGNNALRRVG